MINIDATTDIALKGARRAAVFLGLGINSSRDKSFKDYQLPKDSFLRIVPDEAKEEEIEEFKSVFSEWIITSALREITETLDVFLNLLHNNCLRMAVTKGNAELSDAPIILKKFERLGLDEKFQQIREQYGVETKNENYFLGIKQARNCIVHRRGIVGEKDIDENDGKLRLQWWTIDLLGSSADGKETKLAPDVESGHYSFDVETTIQAKLFSPRERVFCLNEKLALTPREIIEICFLTQISAEELKRSTLKYAESIGVKIVKLDESN